MILHKLAVSCWRRHLEEREIGPFSEGLNVIHAPNGTGKSSLFEALRRGLFDAHHVSGTEIDAICPWGRDLAPRVAVEFSEAGVAYRLEKTFLKSASAKLLRLEDGKFRPLADGREADSRVREILAAEAPGRGLSKQEHWGLAQILWAPQGELNLKSITGSAAEGLRAALGGQLSGGSGGRLEELVEERYLNYYTRTGKPKTGKNAAPVCELEARRDSLKAQLIELRQKQQNFESASHKVEDARNRREQARREADAMRASVESTRKRAEQYTRLQSERRNKLEAESLAKERYEGIAASLERIEATRKEIAELEAKIEAAETRQAELKTDCEKATQLLEQRRGERESARARRSSADQQLKKIDQAREYLADRHEAAALRARLQKIATQEEALREARAVRARKVAPDARTVREARALLAKRDAAAAALAASQIHLTVTPDKAASLRDLTQDKQFHAAAAESLTLSGDALVEIVIEGFGRIRAAGPEGSAEEHRKAIRAAESQLAKLCQPYGDADPDRLERLREEAAALDRATSDLQQKVDTLLDGAESGVLAGKLAQADARLADYAKRFPDWTDTPPVVSDLQNAFEALSGEITRRISEAEDAFDKQQAACSAADAHQSTTLAQTKADRSALESARSRLTDLTKDGLADIERRKAQSDALMTWNAAREQAEGLNRELEAIPDNPAKELEKLEQHRNALEEAEARARDDEKTAEGQLQTLAAEGAYSRLVACEEQMADLDARIEQESLKTEAVRLLRETLEASKAAIVASVAAPVERSASRMLARVSGPRLGGLHLTQDLVPHAVQPELASHAVKLENLSGGEQEQLFLITRLALADVLAKDQRQLVVLDDVLNATDTGRLARVLSLLEEVADRLQIVILTCHPERYRALAQARFFEIDE